MRDKDLSKGKKKKKRPFPWECLIPIGLVVFIITLVVLGVMFIECPVPE